MKLNKIYQGDATELITQLSDQSIDLCLTDFPYGIGYEYDNYHDSRENLIQLINKIMPELFRVCKTIVLTCGHSQMWLYPEPTWVLNWYIPAGNNRNSWGFTTWQPILVYGKDPYLANRMGARPDTIKWQETSEKTGHSCAKPINFWKILLNRVSVKTDDIVLDPFMGSGTTALACIDAEKQWIGFEISQKYIDIANKRIEKYKKRPKSFFNTSDVIYTQTIRKQKKLL